MYEVSFGALGNCFDDVGLVQGIQISNHGHFPRRFGNAVSLMCSEAGRWPCMRQVQS